MDAHRHDRDTLDEMLRASAERAGAHLRASFQLPEQMLPADGVLALYAGGPQTGALATVTARGHPRVAPVTTILHGTSFCIPTVRSAARCRHIRANPATSLTVYGDGWAILAHGTSTLVGPQAPEFNGIDDRALATGLGSVSSWGEGVYVRLAPESLIAWAR